MNKFARFLTPVLAGAVVFGIAFTVRRSVFDASHVTNQTVIPSPISVKTGEVQEWHHALLERDPSRRVESLSEILTRHPASGLSTLANQQTADPEALALILRQWAQTDPRSAAKWVMDKKRDGLVTVNALSPIMEVWAQRDPDALMAWFKEPGHGSAQYSQLPKLIAVVFARDPAAALAMAADFPVYWRLPDEALTWIKADPAAAAKAFMALPSGNNHVLEAATKAVGVWAEKEPTAAVEWAAAQTRDKKRVGNTMMEKCLQVWAEKDPAAAAAYFRSLPPGELKATGIVKAWAAKDPEAALRWAGQANTFERADLIGTAVASVAGSDVGMAAALISQMEDGVLRDTATASLTTAWVAKDPTAALSWAAALPAGPARDKALAETSSTWAEKDSAAAAAWAAKAPEGSLPLKAYSAIMGVVRRDTAAAYAWINELPEGPAGHAIKNMFSFPRESQVDAVLALTEGKNKARIVEQASTKFFQTGPDQALAWALSLPDVKQRQQMRQFVEAIEPTDQPSFWNQMTLEKKAELLQRLK